MMLLPAPSRGWRAYQLQGPSTLMSNCSRYRSAVCPRSCESIDAGIVHQDIQAPEVLAGRLYQGLHIGPRGGRRRVARWPYPPRLDVGEVGVRPVLADA